MNVDGNKIKQLAEYYSNIKGYPDKSSLAKFCEDFDLNYNQWNAYTRNAQVIGIKIIHQLMEIFPNLNLNWVFKDEGAMFSDELIAEVKHPKERISKEITNNEIFKKLDQIHFDIRKFNSENTK